MYESDHIEVAFPGVWQVGIAIEVPSFVRLSLLWQALGSCCAETKQVAWREKGGLSTIWWSKTFGGSILGHKLLCHHMTGTWPNTLFPFLTTLLRQYVGCVGMSYICIFGLFKFILHREGGIIFIEYKSDQDTTLLSHYTQDTVQTPSLTIPCLIWFLLNINFFSLFQWSVRLLCLRLPLFIE